jgi:hypothetical protein
MTTAYPMCSTTLANKRNKNAALSATTLVKNLFFNGPIVLVNLCVLSKQISCCALHTRILITFSIWRIMTGPFLHMSWREPHLCWRLVFYAAFFVFLENNFWCEFSQEMIWIWSILEHNNWSLQKQGIAYGLSRQISQLLPLSLILQ